MSPVLYTNVYTASVYTVIGPGGIGKTVVAQEVAYQCGMHLRGGAWFCDLRSARTQYELLRCIEASLEADPYTGPLEAMSAHLNQMVRSRSELLLVLDNAETLWSMVRTLVDEWSSEADALRIITHSRP